MMVRKRSEEGGVTLDYLRGLHENMRAVCFLPREEVLVFCQSVSFQFIWRAPYLRIYEIGYFTWKEITCILVSRR
jgi:hypothetical protein